MTSWSHRIPDGQDFCQSWLQSRPFVEITEELFLNSELRFPKSYFGESDFLWISTSLKENQADLASMQAKNGMEQDWIGLIVEMYWMNLREMTNLTGK